MSEEQKKAPKEHARTGVVCPLCNEPGCVQVNRTPTMVIFKCPACEHMWATYESGAKPN